MIAHDQPNHPGFDQPILDNSFQHQILERDIQLLPEGEYAGEQHSGESITVNEAVSLMEGYTVNDVYNRIKNGTFHRCSLHIRPLRIIKADVLLELSKPTLRKKKPARTNGTGGSCLSAFGQEPPSTDNFVAQLSKLDAPDMSALLSSETSPAMPPMAAAPLREDLAIAQTLRDCPPLADAVQSFVIEEIALTSVACDETLRLRAKVKCEVVEEYCKGLREGRPFPPVDLFRDGDIHFIGDGQYRVEGARKAGCQTIVARVHEGGRAEALLCAFKSNTSHGQPLTNADKRKKVLFALTEYPNLSGNEIARRCLVSEGMVRHIKTRFVRNEPAKRLGKDGKLQAARKTARNPRLKPDEVLYRKTTKLAELLEIDALRRLQELIEQLIAKHIDARDAVTALSPASLSTPGPAF